MHLGRIVCSFLVLCVTGLTACETLKASKPIVPIREYERMIAGRLDADYVGTENCLSACHAHDRLRRDFDASTMGVQLSEETGLPLVDCESCHGPGSLAIEGLTPARVAADRANGKETACNHDTLIDLNNLPAGAKSLICLKCHTANATFNLHDWNLGDHAVSDVACSDCHQVHAGPDLNVQTEELSRLCFTCHPEVRAEFYLPSRHPVAEQRVICTDCHNAHGSPYEKSLREATVKETCTRCHAEKGGPFIFEHGETTEDCRTCHQPHGSVQNNLLSVQMPFLCLQCHEGHRTDAAATTKDRFYTRCTDCHSEIHGTDIPSASGGGFFTQ